MDFKKALTILEVDENFTNTLLKKAYYKKSLLYHPDKNKDIMSKEKFIEVNEAYTLLQNYKKTENEEIIDFDYIKKIIFILVEKNGVELIKRIFTSLNKDKCLIYYDFLHNNQTILGISNELLKSLEIIVREKIKNNNIYLLNPSLKDIIKNNVYVLQIQDTTYYIPLWHKELVFENLIVKNIPVLPEHILIDEDNNLHYFIQTSIQDVLQNKNLEIVIDDLEFIIESNELVIQSYQMKKYKNIGISKVQKLLLETNYKADIFIHIYLF